MSTELGKLEDLPNDYLERLKKAGVAPLWPMMRNVLPHNAPNPATESGLWSFDKIRPLLIEAGKLTPVEKAERRVLVLSDPGRGVGAMQATSTIYVGLQLLLPGETAPAHKHTPSAVRIIIEGKGGYTVVNGEKLPMDEGDLVLTPGGEWHDHGHEGHEPVIWLDALDLPLFVALEGSYAVERELQKTKNRPDSSQLEYLSSGLVPARKSNDKILKYPMMRFPWTNTKDSLMKLSKYSQSGVSELDYVNPENGKDVLPTMGFTAMLISASKSFKPIQNSTSSVIHVIKGKGKSKINNKLIEWGNKDTFSIPVFSKVEHFAEKDSYLIKIHDKPLQEKLGFFEER